MNNLIRLTGLAVVIDPTADEVKENALATAALIGRVSSPEEQAEAVEAMRALKTVIKDVEDSRKAVKEPVLECGRRIDGAAKAFCSDLDKELQRLMTLCGDYQTLLLKKQRAEEALRKAELDEIERQKQAEIAQSRNHEHLEAIEEKFNNKVAEMAPALKVAPKADGQVVKEEWTFEVVDAWALCRSFPNCIKPEPIRTEIKRLLEAGHKLPGVNAKKVVKSDVRLAPQPKLIEV